MKKKLKNELIKIYEAPPSPGKRTFFRELNMQPMNVGYILRTQITYISKLEWIMSAVLFGITVFMSCFFQTAVFSAVLAFMPFLAVVGVSENMRSVVYGMDELEMSARFSLKSIVLARMGIIGIENMVLALLLAVLIEGKIVQVVLYLLVPYLITVYGSLFIVRNCSAREGIYICMGFSVSVSMAAFLSSLSYRWIYGEQFQFLWAAAVMILVCLNYKEGRRFVKIAECYSL